jgi:two-component system chemotaxis sensor kinase CheA
VTATNEIEIDRPAITAMFAAEASEGIGNMEQAVLQLESQPGDDEALGTVFREAHTLKGNAAALGFPALADLAHVVEELLHRRREGLLELTHERVSLLLESVDAFRELVSLAVAGNGESLPPAVQPLLARIHESLGLEDAAATSEAVAATTGAAGAAPASPTPRAGRTLRVELERLDRMLSLTGEIAVARGRLRRLLSEAQAAGIALDTHEQMDRLSSELQELVLRVRMLPLGPLFRQLRRSVRDAAASCGKGVRLELHGESVEADTSVIEQLKDPLTHMIRNAVDHGIESPADRLAAGKSAEGRILVSARHEGGGLVVEIADDGAGLDRERILERARARGLVRDGERLSGDDVDNLIFEPGLSTANTVTELSGRGVGLDVVRRNVQALRGSLRLASQPGAGTTITIRLPLTLAIIPGFAVSVAGETFVIPMDSVLECLALPEMMAASAAEDNVISLRGQALPCLDLVEHFALGRGNATGRRAVVVVCDARQRAGLVVDALAGQTQAVIRPLGRLFEGLPGLLGSTIGDDGRVGHILDVPALLAGAAARAKKNGRAPLTGAVSKETGQC